MIYLSEIFSLSLTERRTKMKCLDFPIINDRLSNLITVKINKKKFSDIGDSKLIWIHIHTNVMWDLVVVSCVNSQCNTNNTGYLRGFILVSAA